MFIKSQNKLGEISGGFTEGDKRRICIFIQYMKKFGQIIGQSPEDIDVMLNCYL